MGNVPDRRSPQVVVNTGMHTENLGCRRQGLSSFGILNTTARELASTCELDIVALLVFFSVVTLVTVAVISF